MQWLYSLFLFVIIANQVSEHLNWRISTTTNFLFERIMQRMNSVHAKCVPHHFFRLAIGRAGNMYVEQACQHLAGLNYFGTCDKFSFRRVKQRSPDSRSRRGQPCWQRMRRNSTACTRPYYWIHLSVAARMLVLIFWCSLLLLHNRSSVHDLCFACIVSSDPPNPRDKLLATVYGHVPPRKWA